ncbi:putative beta-lactamase-like 1 [Clarias magur]|uniref:Putative beta-lactamase-like 1 n=1 Tax=Clarias magur TaxID=1594786 RepID=A0A8J4UQX8_CLAMG|nr:putative beta-lactamase-like 1 [Clarias magur]
MEIFSCLLTCTYSNMTFYEIKAGSDGILSMQEFGPPVEKNGHFGVQHSRLSYLEERVFKVVFEEEYPCRLKIRNTSISMEFQDRQLFNFYMFNENGLAPGFDVPGLNTYDVMRISRRPIFTSTPVQTLMAICEVMYVEDDNFL